MADTIGLIEITNEMVEAACKAYWPLHWPHAFSADDEASIRAHMRNAVSAAAHHAHNAAVSAARNALVWMEEWPDDLPQCAEDVCEEDGLIGLAMYLDNGKCAASVSFEADGRIVYAVINPATGEGLAKGTTPNFQESFDTVAAAIRQAAEEA